MPAANDDTKSRAPEDASKSSNSREAPPESPSAISTRRLISLAFWLVVFAFGVPHWVWTTSIHRSSLPLDSMNAWADGRTCELRYPIHIDLEHADLDRGRELARQVQDLLGNGGGQDLYSFHVEAAQPNATVGQYGAPIEAQVERVPELKASALTVKVQADSKATSTQASLRSWVPVLDILHNPGRAVDSATLAPFITEEIRRIFENEQQSIAYLLDGSPYAYGEGGSNPLSTEQRTRLNARRTRAFKPASTYHLTFSLFASSASPSAWEIEDALAQYIEPLLSRMSPISHCTIDTQVQLYASFSPSIAGPQYDSATQEWKLQRTDLSGFVNAAEWPLSPGIGSGPTINFLLYVPSKHQSPLVLAETGGNSWLIPQWGGVQILNPTDGQSDTLTAEYLSPVMLTFTEQLSALLGLPQSPPSLSLRMSSLTRERATSLILSASSTLGALARLTLKLTSIAIPDSVATSVDETIRSLDQACQNLREGRYEDALTNARRAEEEAEQAFFEPSMVGQVYFPDEHKVAVYVPLLGPMAVPLVMAALKELNRFRERKVKVS